jgi:hypothetical protein
MGYVGKFEILNSLSNLLFGSIVFMPVFVTALIFSPLSLSVFMFFFVKPYFSADLSLASGDARYSHPHQADPLTSL